MTTFDRSRTLKATAPFAFDLALDFAGASGVMRNVAGGPPEDMGLSVLPARDGVYLKNRFRAHLGFPVN